MRTNGPPKHQRGSSCRVATAVLAALALLPAATSFRFSSVFRDAAGTADNNLCRPQQIHLAVTGAQTEMRIMWKTRGSTCETRVQYGEGEHSTATENSFQQLATMNHPDGSVRSYSSEDMCASPARDFRYAPLVLHDAVLTGLVPGRRYSYKVAHGHEINSFQAAPPVGRKEGFQFLVYGDMGDPDHHRAKAPGAAGTAKYVRRDVEAGADMVLHVGDISYANGDEKVWDSFMDAIEPASKRVPYMVAVGNHEYDYRGQGRRDKGGDPSGSTSAYNPKWGNYGNDSGGECGVTVASRFSMPGDDADANAAAPNGPANPPFWYSYNYGSVHFTVVSTEHSLERDSHQYKWLEADFKSVDRCVTPWLVVAMHRPMYVVYPHKSNRRVADHLRGQLEGLFNEVEVDLVLSGHVHSYARTCNVLDERCVAMEEGGMTHITLGCGGHKLSDVAHSQEDWLVHTKAQFGYGRVTVTDGYSLKFEYVRTKDGKVNDSYVLKNSRADRRKCFQHSASASVTEL